MDPHLLDSAEQLRARLECGLHQAVAFREALLAVPPRERDGWVDRVLGLGELPEDGPALPGGCAPYLPCPVDVLLRLVDQVPVRASDVFVDVGSGLGRAAALVSLLTDAASIGLEIQPELVQASRALAARLPATRLACIQGDATELAGDLTIGSVFFLYCPFSGERLARVLAELEAIARTRVIRVCCLDLPLPPCPWLALDSEPGRDLEIYRSTLLDRAATPRGSAPA